MALMKSEFLYQYHKVHNRQLRDYIFAYTPDIADTFNLLFNWGVSFINSKWGNWIKPLIGIHPNRSIPGAKQKKINGIPKNQAWSTISPKDFDIILYLDEFTYNFDSELITKAIVVLEKLGYKVLVSPKMNSGRSLISKGFLDRAIEEAKRHLTIFENVIYHNIPIVGLEPSSILTLRDELPKLVGEADRTLAYKQSKLAFTIEEFLWDEYEKGHWKTDHFTNQSEHYHIHAHCHFKALGKEDSLYHLISILPGSHSYKISSGCCGMAGSFGFEKEKYALSMSIANETLFPYISKLSESDHIVAHGTSCRQQIVDGLNKSALHPIEVLYRRLIQ
jgi:Fe-S oxidoreductase